MPRPILSPAKTEKYPLGFSGELLSEMVLRSVFKLGTLPVKYLGLPFNTWKALRKGLQVTH